jgi:cytochrome c-type biogenesis protein CcmH
LSSFWILVPIIALAAAAVILVPLLRAHFVRQATDSRPGVTIGTGIVVGLLVPAAAVVLYAKWTTWNWSGATPAAGQSVQQQDMAHSMEEAIAALEARLAANPDDAAGWSMLGRSYLSLSQFSRAADAYRKSVELTNGDPAARADYAEALAMSDPAGLKGEAGEIFRELVPTASDNPKVLWYGGLIAFESGDTAEGRRLWIAILELNPPESLRQIVEQRLKETESGMSSEPAQAATPQAAVAATEPPVAKEQPVATEKASADTGGPIQLSISLADGLADRVTRNAPLFIFARGAAGGPPLAVVRRTYAELPLDLTLSDANAMTAGVSLSDHDPLILVARLSLSGSPGAQPGDLFGEVSYSRSGGPETTIIIDQVVP